MHTLSCGVLKEDPFDDSGKKWTFMKCFEHYILANKITTIKKVSMLFRLMWTLKLTLKRMGYPGEIKHNHSVEALQAHCTLLKWTHCFPKNVTKATTAGKHLGVRHNESESEKNKWHWTVFFVSRRQIFTNVCAAFVKKKMKMDAGAVVSLILGNVQKHAETNAPTTHWYHAKDIHWRGVKL